MIAYLSGAMENAINEGADWRNDITIWLNKNLGHGIVDPVIESRRLVEELDSFEYREWKNIDRTRYVNFVRQLVNQDLDAVEDRSDYLICIWDKAVTKGGGTHGEVTVAFRRGVPVYLVCLIPLEELSGWILSCSTEIFSDIDSLKRFLLKEYRS